MNKSKKEFEKNLLTDPIVEPKDDILVNTLGKKYVLYTEFRNKISKKNFVLEWNYYSDTKSWLCRILNDNKNYGWLSILNSGLKIIFYFNKETINGIYQLDIDDGIKELAKEKEIGRKNPPVAIIIENKKYLTDAIKILEYRINI